MKLVEFYSEDELTIETRNGKSFDVHIGHDDIIIDGWSFTKLVREAIENPKWSSCS